MSKRELLLEQQEETSSIIAELLEDGSDPDALYLIEHHLSSENFDLLEKAVVDAFKLGYEVSDAEELETEEGGTVFCCDVISEVELNVDLINQQVEQMFLLAERCHVNYDGWGTYFEDPNADDDEENSEIFLDQDDDGKRH